MAVPARCGHIEARVAVDKPAGLNMNEGLRVPNGRPPLEIAGELHVSLNTVGTHVRTLYLKLGAHDRREAVDRARALGLLAPAGRR